MKYYVRPYNAQYRHACYICYKWCGGARILLEDGGDYRRRDIAICDKCVVEYKLNDSTYLTEICKAYNDLYSDDFHFITYLNLL